MQEIRGWKYVGNGSLGDYVLSLISRGHIINSIAPIKYEQVGSQNIIHEALIVITCTTK